MRIMAIDYGTRSIGVALSDELQITARPLLTIRRQQLSVSRIIARLRSLIDEYEVETLVIGLPLRADGTRGEAAVRVEDFINKLQSQLNLPIVTVNEFLSSREADELLRDSGANLKERKQRSDEYAAAIILRDYLEAQTSAANSTTEEFATDY